MNGPHPQAAAAIHASCVLIGEGAVLVRGEAGAGKTGLCLALLAAARARGLFGRLVADDRVLIEARSGRLVARPHRAVAGLIERRGLGLTPAIHEAAACIRLVVDLVAEPPERLPEPQDLVVEIAGVTLPRIAAMGGEEAAGAEGLVLAALVLFGDEPWREA
jgi:serine kinase of HPr protein (carbohydrate metabolism regulator)